MLPLVEAVDRVVLTTFSDTTLRLLFDMMFTHQLPSTTPETPAPPLGKMVAPAEAARSLRGSGDFTGIYGDMT